MLRDVQQLFSTLLTSQSAETREQSLIRCVRYFVENGLVAARLEPERRPMRKLPAEKNPKKQPLRLSVILAKAVEYWSTVSSAGVLDKKTLTSKTTTSSKGASIETIKDHESSTDETIQELVQVLLSPTIIQIFKNIDVPDSDTGAIKLLLEIVHSALEVWVSSSTGRHYPKNFGSGGPSGSVLISKKDDRGVDEKIIRLTTNMSPAISRSLLAGDPQVRLEAQKWVGLVVPFLVAHFSEGRDFFGLPLFAALGVDANVAGVALGSLPLELALTLVKTPGFVSLDKLFSHFASDFASQPARRHVLVVKKAVVPGKRLQRRARIIVAAHDLSGKSRDPVRARVHTAVSSLFNVQVKKFEPPPSTVSQARVENFLLDDMDDSPHSEDCTWLLVPLKVSDESKTARSGTLHTLLTTPDNKDELTLTQARACALLKQTTVDLNVAESNHGPVAVLRRFFELISENAWKALDEDLEKDHGIIGPHHEDRGLGEGGAPMIVPHVSCSGDFDDLSRDSHLATGVVVDIM